LGLGSEALSYTVIIGSPISAAILYLYTNSIKKRGPYLTLLISNIVCVAFFTYITFFLPTLRGNMGKYSVLLYYSFREIYVTLLSTQQWSFIATVLNKSKSSHMVKYSGLISIASAIGGLLVEHIVKYGGVQYLLYMSLLATVLSWLLDEIAYAMVVDHNAASTRVLLQRAEIKKSALNKHIRSNFWIAAAELIYKTDTLRILFFEAIIHQLCGNMLNITFHDGLRKSIPDSSLRAVVVGRFFASVNTIACVLQCFVLPHILSHQSLPQFLMIIPIIVLLATVLSCFDRTELFLQDTLAFGAVKILEYSIMTSATEMIYMPLDCEVRYVGKEFIRFFGHRLGKSFASIILCTFNAKYQWSHFSQAAIAIVFACIWELIMLILAQHIVQTTDATAKPASPLPTSSKARSLDAQVLSSSRSTSFLPDVFQWSNNANSMSIASNLNSMVTTSASTAVSASNSSTSSFASMASNEESLAMLSSSQQQQHGYEEEDDEDVGLSLGSSSKDEYDEEDWSSRPLLKVISLNDLSQNVSKTLSSTLFHRNLSLTSAVSSDLTTEESSVAMISRDASSSSSNNTANANPGLRRRRNQEMILSTDSPKDLLEDDIPPRRRQ
jgi:hypothetical protein